MIGWILFWAIPAILLLGYAFSQENDSLGFILSLIAFIPIANLTAFMIILLNKLISK